LIPCGHDAARVPFPMTNVDRNFPAASNSNNKDDGDFERLMRQEGPRIFTLAVRLTGNIADGQDLAQETFVRAYKNFAGFRGEAQFGTWIWRICVNLWKNRVVYEKRRSFWKHISLGTPKNDDDGPGLDLPSGEPPLDRPLEINERQRLVADGLAALEPKDRAILVLRDMEDRAYEEIAELLDIPLGTVKSRLARGRGKLREKLKKYFKDAP